MDSNPLGSLANFCQKFGARMELENDDKTGQGRGAFNPATRVQIPGGASSIWGYIQVDEMSPFSNIVLAWLRAEKEKYKIIGLQLL